LCITSIFIKLFVLKTNNTATTCYKKAYVFKKELPYSNELTLLKKKQIVLFSVHHVTRAGHDLLAEARREITRANLCRLWLNHLQKKKEPSQHPIIPPDLRAPQMAQAFTHRMTGMPANGRR
jgi:hypothetical protein